MCGMIISLMKPTKAILYDSNLYFKNNLIPPLINYSTFFLKKQIFYNITLVRLMNWGYSIIVLIELIIKSSMDKKTWYNWKLKQPKPSPSPHNKLINYITIRLMKHLPT